MELTNMEKLSRHEHESCRIFAQAIETLSQSQGFYCRIKEMTDDFDADTYDNFVQDVIEKDFKDILDVVFELEV